MVFRGEYTEHKYSLMEVISMNAGHRHKSYLIVAVLLSALGVVRLVSGDTGWISATAFMKAIFLVLAIPALLTLINRMDGHTAVFRERVTLGLLIAGGFFCSEGVGNTTQVIIGVVIAVMSYLYFRRKDGCASRAVHPKC